jgi:hypothetical protein
MKQALAASSIPVPENTRNRPKRQPQRMNNSINKGTLGAVRPGDILTLQHSRFRVLSSQRAEDLVTLELDDTPEQPLTLIGIPSMAVNVESGKDSRATPRDPGGQ